MAKKIKNIIIFGGGTSGWLTAAYLTNKLNFPVQVTLIESKKMGPIGVGEGTQPATARFLFDAGLNPKDWMKPSAATFKYGVLFEGWNKEPYFIDNDFIENTIIGPNFYTHDYFYDKSPGQYRNWLPSYRLSMANKSPKMAGYDHLVSMRNFRDFGAVHFSATNIIEVIHKLIKNRIQYFDTKIVEVKKDKDGIKSLIDEKGRAHKADLFIDCSGFEARLIDKELHTPFMDISSILPCDRAVALPTEYRKPKEECHPFTKSTAMNAGWRWTIPTFRRIGNGYVYSSKYISPEVAEAELRSAIGEFKAEALHLKMRCGSHEKIAAKNVVAVGLSAGFVEPLEATGITFTTMIIENLVELLNHKDGDWSQSGKNLLNKVYLNMFLETTAFIWAHYHFSHKNDTAFWKSIRNQKLKKTPEFIQDIIKMFHPKFHRNFFIDLKSSSFHTGHWFSILHSNGAVGSKSFPLLSEEQRKYAEHYVKIKSFEIDSVIKTFPNHYEDLKKWYGS